MLKYYKNHIKLATEKITNIRIAYLTFQGIYILGFFFGLEQIKLVGSTASCVAWGMYILLFYIYIRFTESIWLLTSNICFFISHFVFIYFTLEEESSIYGLVFSTISILLFLLISKRTLYRIYDKYFS